MNRKTLFVGIVLLLFLAAGCVQQAGETSGEAENGAADSEVKFFEMTAKRYEFNPSTITVSEGDTVRIQLTSIDVAHGIKLDDFGVNERVDPGETKTIEFVAEKAGTFEFRCPVYCGLGHGNMKGTLVVE